MIIIAVIVIIIDIFQKESYKYKRHYWVLDGLPGFARIPKRKLIKT